VKVTKPTNYETESMSSSELDGLRSLILVQRWNTKTRITHKRHDLQGYWSRYQVTWSVWQLLARKLITKSPRNTKIGKKVAIQRVIMRIRFEVKRSKVTVTRPINAETESMSHTNYKLDRRFMHALSTATASYKGLLSWVIAPGRGYIVSAASIGVHTTCG